MRVETGNHRSLGEGRVPMLVESTQSPTAPLAFRWVRGLEKIAPDEEDFLRQAVAFEKNLVNLLDGEMRELFVKQCGFRQSQPRRFVDHSIHHDVGGDIPEMRIRRGAALHMAQGGVKKLMHKNPELLRHWMRGHELRVE